MSGHNKPFGGDAGCRTYTSDNGYVEDVMDNNRTYIHHALDVLRDELAESLGRAAVTQHPPLIRYRVVIEFDADGPDRAQLAADHIAHGVGVAATVGCIDNGYTVDWHEV